MARIKIYNYTFTPGAANVGVVRLPGFVKLDEILMITNTTTQTIIYNFADTTKGGTVAYNATDTQFGQEGTTTLTLEISTVGQLSTHKLNIYLDQLETLHKPAETFQDPVQKLRVSQPQSLIDTDFEYGIQPIKWEFVGLNNNIPSYFIRTSDSPLPILNAGAGVLFAPTSIVANGTTTITVNTVAGNVTPLVAGVSVVYIFGTNAPAANGVFTVATKATTSFTYTATANVTSATISNINTRIGSTATNGPSVFVRTSADISPANLNVLVGTPFNIQETANEPLADGSFLVERVDQQAKLFSYNAKGTLTATPSFATAFTTAFVGKFYGENVAGAGIPLVANTSASVGGVVVTTTGTTVTVTTANAHNLYVGSQIFVSGTTNEFANGSFQVLSVPNETTFTFTAEASITGPVVLSQGATLAYPLGTQVYARPDANLLHRAQDGGVSISTTFNVTGQQAIRQTRRYFRYQSGKGIQFSTACQFKPAFDISNLVAVSTTATVTTEVDHGLSPGARIKIEGVTVSTGIDRYTGEWTVATVPSLNTLTYTMAAAPTDLAPRVVEKMTVISWYGARTRSGLFDEQNGFFFEFDGQRLFAVRRNSTTQLRGTLSVCTNQARVNGIGTQFNKELRVNDYIVIKGMSYQVARIISATALDIAPAYRAPTPSTASGSLGLQLASVQGIQGAGTTTVTVNTRLPHNLTVGQRIQVYNSSSANANGSWVVASTPLLTRFTFTTTLTVPSATISNLTTFTATTTAGSNILTAVSSTNGLSLGQTLTATNIPVGTIITLIGGSGIAPGSTSLTITSGGAGYQRNRSFGNIPLRNVSATGTGVRAFIQTNNAGVISFISVQVSGNGYAIGTTLTVNASDIGGSGGGALFTIATLTGAQLTMSAAASASGATQTVGVEVARIFAEESNVRYTKTIDQRIPQSAWSIDRVDGTGPSGYIMNLNKIQMIYIDYQWYGAGYIRFGMRAKTGEIYYCHKILHNNFLTEAYMRSGNVPARFEVNTVGPITFLTADMTNVITSLSCADTTDFPVAGQIRIEGELINYTGKTATTLTGLTRGVAGGTAGAAHTGTIAGANGQNSIRLVTQQLSPSLSHWGVSVIMDGRFDEDVSYVFVTPKQTASQVTPGQQTPLMSIRVSPSVDSGIARPFGVRNLLNRMQLKLRSLGIFTNAPLLVQARLNCTSPLFKSDNWLVDPVGNGSLAQVIYHNTNDQIFGGDQISAFFVDSSSPTQFRVATQSLDAVKDLGTSVLSGDGVYPDGPEVLTIFVTNLGNSVATTTSAAPTVGQFQVAVADVTGLKPGMSVASSVAGIAIGAQVVSITPGTTAIVTLSKPNAAVTQGAIVFDETATVYGRLSWTEAQA